MSELHRSARHMNTGSTPGFLLCVSVFAIALGSGCRSHRKTDIAFSAQDRLFMNRDLEIQDFKKLAQDVPVDSTDGISIGEAYRCALEYIKKTWPNAPYDSWLPTDRGDCWTLNVYDTTMFGGTVVHALSVSMRDGSVSEREPYEEDWWRPLDQMREYMAQKRQPNQALQTTPMTRSVCEKNIEFGRPQRGV